MRNGPSNYLLTWLYLSDINSGGLKRFHVEAYSFLPVYDNEIYMIAGTALGI
jgi:hypothetical protein